MTPQFPRRATAVTPIIILAVFGSMTVYTQTTPPLAASAVSANTGVEARAAAWVEVEPRQVRILLRPLASGQPGTAASPPSRSTAPNAAPAGPSSRPPPPRS